MSYETLELEVRDGVAHIALNRPKAANAIDLQLAKDLMNAALQCDEDPAVRAILISGRGKMFCAGGDLGSFADAGEELPRLIKEMTTYLHAAISKLARCRAPVIASVGGAAAGAGFSLCCAVDLVVASEDAKFSMAYTGAGLTPDGSSTFFLPRIVGTRRALDLMLTNRALSAGEALEWGLVNQIVPAGDLAEASEKLASQLASGPTAAFGAVKKLVGSSLGDSLETQMELEGRAIADSARTADAREGIDAFFAKRRPKFTGK
jgi:2-(1,2-epoxy-1,2-dihydrophenyl)acetyl-CoA isomerase